ncbi:MAG: phosphate acyltransferase PlsX [Firmicutes bacterium]|nr:phosphate acyltransferase PlsX [Bacillota bacterium]
MGGDHAPQATVAGALQALAADPQLRLLLVGERTVVEAELRRAGASPSSRLEIRHAGEVIGYDEEPVQAFRRKRDSSIAVGLRLVRDGQASAFVSAGSTGALMAGSLFTFGRIQGVRRPALVQVMPTLSGPGLVFLDMGATVAAAAEDLVQWALMGAIYAETVLGRPAPRVALLNVGTEAEKGPEEVKKAYQTLSRLRLNFIGNIEARELLSGAADVVVVDGFAGNIALKTVEGLARDLMRALKRELGSSLRTKLGAWLALPALRRLAARFDAQEAGGAPLLGVNGLCVKCHGNSTPRAIAAGLRVGAGAARGRLVEAIARRLAERESGETDE